MQRSIELPLGKSTDYKQEYDKNLLVGIPRSLGRDQIGLSLPLPFKGVDIWNCYEVSWLNNKGRPCVRIIEFIVPVESDCIVESKSMKLYLNSLNGTCFFDENDVLKTIERDLSELVKADVVVKIKELKQFKNQRIETFKGINIDNLDVEINDYNVNAELLKLSADDYTIEETLYSDLLKSNCLITNQPDWASVQIKYKGKKIDHKSLLKYLISFRNHSEFHEQCVEHIFNDIMKKCTPEELTVHAKYTRRGGIDINPYRTTMMLDFVNTTRDIRQ